MVDASTGSRDDLRALTEAGVALTSETSLDLVLQKVVDIAHEQLDARYAALSVLDLNGAITRFITAGITEEQRQAIGHIPEGKGLLGVLLHEGQTIRLDDMKDDPRSIGFPLNHPPMTSLLGVPLIFRGAILGNLYLTDKIGATGFSARDEVYIRLLATQAAVAIRNAELREKADAVARLEERERIGMDLHDGVMQTIYAVGLNLEDAAERAEEDPASVKQAIDRAIDALNDVIKDIRSYIFDLRPRVSVVADLPEAIRQLVDDIRVNTLIQTTLEMDTGLPRGLTQDQALALFHITQEALNNVAKHSGAKAVSVRLTAHPRSVEVEVCDNGTGFDPGASHTHEHHGLRNMRDRARAVGASLSITGTSGEGTTVRAEVSIRISEG
ncbi:MAG TPA: GAF domain-containing sensor histidine kinase [Dehalococcoidia bacterium]|nr:GAF domain-containing sensor histidine kinase [Dehalococcoidia bacterium]